MNTAAYKNAHNRYPVSTDTLDFIQEQIKLPYEALDLLVGDNHCILKQPTTSEDGLMMFNHELMPLRWGNGTQSSFILLITNEHAITVQNTVFNNARTERYAQYVVTESESTVAVSEVLTLDSLREMKSTISDLNTQLSVAMNAAIPIGMIMMWDPVQGAIPQGWALCDGQTVNGIKTPNLINKFAFGAPSSLHDFIESVRGTPDGPENDQFFEDAYLFAGQEKIYIDIENLPQTNYLQEVAPNESGFFAAKGSADSGTKLGKNDQVKGQGIPWIPRSRYLFFIMKVA